MRMRSFLGMAMVAIGLCAILAPLDVLYGVANLVLTAADNPFSIEALVMVAISIVLTVVVAMALIAMIDGMKMPRRTSHSGVLYGIAGQEMRRGQPVTIGADGKLYLIE